MKFYRKIIRVLQTLFAWIYNEAFYSEKTIGSESVKGIVDRKFNLLSTHIKHGNQDMWEFNLETRKIGKIPLIKQDNGNYRGFANPNFPSVWAINKKNAIRKFSNHGYNEEEILD